MYKQSFSCKINCTKVKYSASKLHKSADETDKALSRSLLQMSPAVLLHFCKAPDMYKIML